MRGPVPTPDDSSATLAQPGIVIFLVLLLGAVIYLRQARYLRRRTAYVTIAIILAALIFAGVQTYQAAG